MGWGLTVNGMYLSRVTRSELEDRLKDNEAMMDMYRLELTALVVYSHPSYPSMDGDIPIIEYAYMRIPEIVEQIEELSVQSALIRRAIDNPESVEGEDG